VINKRTNIEKILTRHPEGKSGKNVSLQTYELFKNAILKVIGENELTHTDLMKKLNSELRRKFEGNISWYGETIKLDLEARRLIERTDSKPQKYRVR
jgi:hypothetical protein